MKSQFTGISEYMRINCEVAGNWNLVEKKAPANGFIEQLGIIL
jgi:hypothetical protein